VKVLFDTNVLYSAFTAKGVCEDIVYEAAGAHDFIWSEPLRRELENSLRRKYKLGPGSEIALEALADLCEFVTPVALTPPVCRDPDDDVVLATALAGKADLIVTGDADLLALKEFAGIRIVSPRTAVGVLAA
jgi:putative PIN family toxin of toxin-antitoxin system